MTYGVNADVRKLAGNPTTSDIASADIDTYITRADSEVEKLTGHTGYTSSDTEYYLVVQISNLLAAAWIMDYFKDTEGKAEKYRAQAQALIDAIKQSTRSSFAVVAQGYRTSPLSDDEAGDLIEP